METKIKWIELQTKADFFRYVYPYSQIILDNGSVPIKTTVTQITANQMSGCHANPNYDPNDRQRTSPACFWEVRFETALSDAKEDKLSVTTKYWPYAQRRIYVADTIPMFPEKGMNYAIYKTLNEHFFDLLPWYDRPLTMPRNRQLTPYRVSCPQLFELAAGAVAADALKTTVPTTDADTTDKHET